MAIDDNTRKHVSADLVDRLNRLFICSLEEHYFVNEYLPKMVNFLCSSREFIEELNMYAWGRNQENGRILINFIDHIQSPDFYGISSEDNDDFIDLVVRAIKDKYKRIKGEFSDRDCDEVYAEYNEQYTQEWKTKEDLNYRESLAIRAGKRNNIFAHPWLEFLYNRLVIYHVDGEGWQVNENAAEAFTALHNQIWSERDCLNNGGYSVTREIINSRYVQEALLSGQLSMAEVAYLDYYEANEICKFLYVECNESEIKKIATRLLFEFTKNNRAGFVSLLLRYTSLWEKANGQTVLHLAIKEDSCAEIVFLFINKSNNYNKLLLIKDSQGNTPLMLALSLYDHSIARQEDLSEYAAGVNSNKLLYAQKILNKLDFSNIGVLRAINNTGMSPLKYAQINKLEIYRQMQRKLNPPPPPIPLLLLPSSSSSNKRSEISRSSENEENIETKRHRLRII